MDGSVVGVDRYFHRIRRRIIIRSPLCRLPLTSQSSADVRVCHWAVSFANEICGKSTDGVRASLDDDRFDVNYILSETSIVGRDAVSTGRDAPKIEITKKTRWVTC
jgi:hypothetical protein